MLGEEKRTVLDDDTLPTDFDSRLLRHTVGSIVARVDISPLRILQMDRARSEILIHLSLSEKKANAL